MFIDNNGEILPADSYNIDINNRAFRYGDSLFESIRVINGKPVGLKIHLDRLFKGMSVFQIEQPEHYDEAFFQNAFRNLIEKNGITEGGRARLTVYRDKGGFFRPTNMKPRYSLEIVPFEHNSFLLNEEGMTVDLYPNMRKQNNKLALFKTGNSALYIMASIYATKQGWDDCLLQNTKLGIIESSNSNLFIVSNGVLYTPGLDTGCVGGTMRMQIINLAIENNIQVYESNITPQNLLVADELFLTNAIQGIRWVVSYKTKRYYNTMSSRLVGLLNENLAE